MNDLAETGRTVRASPTDVQFVAAVTSASDDNRVACVSLALSRYEDWLDNQSELWTAGGSVQREIFAETLRTLLSSSAGQDGALPG